MEATATKMVEKRMVNMKESTKGGKAPGRKVEMCWK